MKTKTLLACLATGLLGLVQSARAAGNPVTDSHIVSLEARHHAHRTQRGGTLTQPAVSGAIPRAIRSDNPLEMLNPFAPAKYGTAEESVLFDPDVPGKVEGIKLLSISF